MARTKKNLRKGGAKRRAEEAGITQPDFIRRPRVDKDVLQAARELIGLRQSEALPTPEAEDVEMTPVPVPARRSQRKLAPPTPTPTPTPEAEDVEMTPVPELSRDRPTPSPCPSDIMKYHLRADMAHDHGAPSFTGENEEFALLYGGNQGGIKSIDEDDVIAYIKSDDPFAIDRDFRVNNRLSFRQDERTEMFPQHGGSVFKPFIDVDNSKVAVLQDAGVQLFRAINAQNLLTFGSILDQAGKPVEKDDKPVFFNYPAGSIEIDPCIYGFNPDVVRNKITIDKFNGRHARCVFNYKYRNIDNILGGTNGLLFMNRRGGDFMSNKEVKNIKNHTSQKMGAYIGKALGDIMLVASITKKIGNVENKFLSNDLQFLHEPDKKISVERFMLNTGDRLNHARAFMFGVDSVYSIGRDGIRTFEYIPGVNQKALTPIETKIMYLQRIKDLIVQIDTAYGTFIKHLKTEVIKNNKFDSDKSSKCGANLISEPAAIERATKVIEYLIDVVEVYRTYVLYYLLVCYKHFEIVDDNEDLKNAYEILLHKSAGLMPSDTTTMNINGKDIRSAVTILKTDYLYFSNYTIIYENIDIKYSDQYNILFGRGTPPSTQIPKRKVEQLMREINPDRVEHTIVNKYPIVSLYGGLIKTHTFYVSDVYQLIGKKQKLHTPSSNIFWTFQFNDKPTSVIPPAILNVPTAITGTGRDLMVGGQFPKITEESPKPTEQFSESIEVFAQTFKRPQESFQSIGDLTPLPEKEYRSDLLIDFLKENTIEELVGAVQTYKENEYSIIDTTLLRSVYTDYKNARTSLLPLMSPTEDETLKDAYELAVPQLPNFPKEGEFGVNKDKHTKESLLFNAFACRYNGDLIRADKLELPLKNKPTAKPSERTRKYDEEGIEDLEYTLDNYVSEFKRLALIRLKPSNIDQAKSGIFIFEKEPKAYLNQTNNQTNNLPMGSSPIQSPRTLSRTPSIATNGGQRVPAENPLIDLTKSFVRRGGSSPNSEVK